MTLEIPIRKRARDWNDLEVQRSATMQKVSDGIDVENGGIDAENGGIDAQDENEELESNVAFEGERRNQCLFKRTTVAARGSMSELHHLDVIEVDDEVIEFGVEEEYGAESTKAVEGDDPWFKGDKEYFSEGACEPFDVADSGSEVDSDMYAPAQWNDF